VVRGEPVYSMFAPYMGLFLAKHYNHMAVVHRTLSSLMALTAQTIYFPFKNEFNLAYHFVFT